MLKRRIEVPAYQAAMLETLIERYAAAVGETPDRCRDGFVQSVMSRGLSSILADVQRAEIAAAQRRAAE